MWLRSLNIGKRLGLAFSLLGALVLGMGIFSLILMIRMDAASDEVREHWLPALQASEQVTTSVGRIRALTLRSVLLTDAADRQATIGIIDGVNRELPAQIAAYVKHVNTPAEQEMLQRFQKAYSDFSGLQQQILDAVRNERKEDAIRLANGPLALYADTLTAALNTIGLYNNNGASTATETGQQAFILAERMVIGAIVVALVLTVLLALVLTRSITRPLAESLQMAETVASGDLTQAIVVVGSDEPARLAAALQRMQQNLRTAIQSIADSSSQLASASEELHAVTADATRGLQQQSNEIEQAATAVNQMTTAVEEVARNAVSTSQASQESTATAQRGSEQVSETVESINRLAQDVASTSGEVEQLAGQIHQISSVLDVIRAIADQTNLLALNAAIEAARAGEAGRGFAVVADEVRALAHRTQQSTQEIEQMIGGIQSGAEKTVRAMQGSNQRANSTLAVAEAAGVALGQITLAISAINERNLVIASASEEQAQVAKEVDRNLVNIRDLSLQSSAGADQTNVASQELSRLAVGLSTLVARFRV